MQKTRWNILSTLKSKGPKTAAELGEELHITPMGVRQHLATLERDGLVSFETESRGLGRSSHVYSLTNSGDECFPRVYDHLANELIEIVDELDEDKGVARLFKRRTERLEALYRARMRGRTIRERVNELAQIRNEEGFMASCQPLGDGSFLLVESNCAIHKVAAKCPDACQAELTLFERVLDGARVTRDQHIVGGDRCCAYRVEQARESRASKPESAES